LIVQLVPLAEAPTAVVAIISHYQQTGSQCLFNLFHTR